MDKSVSPRIAKLAAVAILVVVGWLTTKVIWFYVAGRLELSSEIEQLEETVPNIAARRVDLAKLQTQLSTLAASPQVRRSTMTAASKRDALNQLTQTIRGSLDEVHGKLLSLNEAASANQADIIAAQLHARMEEAKISRWLSHIGQGEVRPRIAEIVISSQDQAASSVDEVDFSAVLRMPWASAGRSSP
jgi:hypothetical protein